MLIDGDSSGLSQPRIVRRIATALRSAYRSRASFGVSQPRFVRRIATALRSVYRNRASFLLGTVQGQPSATMVGIDGGLGKSSPLQVHRSFAMLVSRLINHPGDSLADSRWSLGDAMRAIAAIGVFGGRCDSVMRKRRSNEKLQVSRG
jgi:hypothetical protein